MLPLHVFSVTGAWPILLIVVICVTVIAGLVGLLLGMRKLAKDMIKSYGLPVNEIYSHIFEFLFLFSVLLFMRSGSVIFLVILILTTGGSCGNVLSFSSRT